MGLVRGENGGDKVSDCIFTRVVARHPQRGEKRRISHSLVEALVIEASILAKITKKKRMKRWKRSGGIERLKWNGNGLLLVFIPIARS